MGVSERVVFLNHSNGEWQAVYLDGHKIYEGRQMEPVDILHALGVTWRAAYDTDHLCSAENAREIYPAELPHNIRTYEYRLNEVGKHQDRSVSKEAYTRAYELYAKNNGAASEREFSKWSLYDVAEGYVIETPQFSS